MKRILLIVLIIFTTVVLFELLYLKKFTSSRCYERDSGFMASKATEIKNCKCLGLITKNITVPDGPTFNICKGINLGQYEVNQ